MLFPKSPFSVTHTHYFSAPSYSTLLPRMESLLCEALLKSKKTFQFLIDSNSKNMEVAIPHYQQDRVGLTEKTTLFGSIREGRTQVSCYPQYWRDKQMNIRG